MKERRLCALLVGALNASSWSAPPPAPPWSARVDVAPAVVATSQAHEPSETRAARRASRDRAGRDAKSSQARIAPGNEGRFGTRCDDVRAVIVSDLADGSASMATLRVGSKRRSWTGRVGDELEDARLMQIGSSPRTGEPRVWIRRRGAVCQASLDPPPSAQEPASEASPPPAHTLRTMVGPVRVVPVLPAGEIAGVRVQGVRRGSLLTLLGIGDGDLIVSIDGKSPPTPARVLEAYGRVVTRSALGLVIGVQRRGAVITIRYRFS